jgi:hypothetical protein
MGNAAVATRIPCPDFGQALPHEDQVRFFSPPGAETCILINDKPMGHSIPVLIILALAVFILVLFVTGLVFQLFWAKSAADKALPITPGQLIEQLSVTDEGHPWQQFWGESYGRELKQRLLGPVFDQLESEDKIGNLIVDVGSGAAPVTQLLQTRPGRKRICVDIAADNTRSPDALSVRLDAEKVGETRTLSFRKALLRACAFLKLNPRTEPRMEHADTLVFSDILNYVDFRKVLRGFSSYLKPHGRMIVVNLPFRGNRSLFSGKGLKDNHELYAFLEEHHFEIEYKAFPKMSPKQADESEEYIVLVARKCLPPEMKSALAV